MSLVYSVVDVEPTDSDTDRTDETPFFRPLSDSLARKSTDRRGDTPGGRHNHVSCIPCLLAGYKYLSAVNKPF